MKHKDIKQLCRTDVDICPIYIKISRREDVDATYLLSVKSNFSRPHLIRGNETHTTNLLADEHYYFYSYVKTTHNLIINSFFDGGEGEFFVKYVDNIAGESPTHKKSYPVKKEDSAVPYDRYSGSDIMIKKEDLQEKCVSGECILKITIRAKEFWYMSTSLTNQFTIYTEERKININEKVIGSIEPGQYHYFITKTTKSDKYLYISTSDVNGDIDVLVNFGEGNYPTIEKTTWRTSYIQNGFVIIDLQDENFKEFKDKSKQFSIAVYGYSKSKYKLYVSAHPNKINMIDNYSTVSCEAKEKQYCYFAYTVRNDIFYIFNDLMPVDGVKVDGNAAVSVARNDTMEALKLIVYTKYLYGKGHIFTKLLSGDDIKKVDYYGMLPAEPDKDSDYSSVFKGDENLLKVHCKDYLIKF